MNAGIVILKDGTPCIVYDDKLPFPVKHVEFCRDDYILSLVYDAPGTSKLFARAIVSSTFIPFWVARDFVADMVWMRNPTARYTTYKKSRGMTIVRDWHDWLGGYPFEAAKPEAIILPLATRGFRLTNLVTCYGSVGCVEYVFSLDDKASR